MFFFFIFASFIPRNVIADTVPVYISHHVTYFWDWNNASGDYSNVNPYMGWVCQNPTYRLVHAHTPNHSGSGTVHSEKLDAYTLSTSHVLAWDTHSSTGNNLQKYMPQQTIDLPADIYNMNISFWWYQSNAAGQNKYLEGIKLYSSNNTALYDNYEDHSHQPVYNTWVQKFVDITGSVDYLSEMNDTTLTLCVMMEDGSLYFTTQYTYFDDCTVNIDYYTIYYADVYHPTNPYLPYGGDILFYNNTQLNTTTTIYTSIFDFYYNYMNTTHNGLGNHIDYIFSFDNGFWNINSLVYYGLFTATPMINVTSLQPVKLTLLGIWSGSSYLQENGTNYYSVQSGISARYSFDSNQLNMFLSGMTGYASGTGLFFGQGYNVTGTIYYTGRTYLVFDTSSLQEGIDILNVTLQLGVFYANGNDYLIVSNASTMNTPALSTDYNKIYYSNTLNNMLGYMSKNALTPSLPALDYHYSNITLNNSTAINYNGYSKYVLRSSNDLFGIVPIGDEMINIQGVGFGNPPTGYQPRLEVWYKGASQLDIYTTGYAYIVGYPDIFIDSNYAGTGSTITQVSVGIHIISFGNYFNYYTPKPVTVTLYKNQEMNITGVYYTKPSLPVQPPVEPITVFGISLTNVISGGFISSIMMFFFGLIGDKLEHAGYAMGLGLIIGLYISVVAKFFPIYFFIGGCLILGVIIYLNHRSNSYG